MDNMESSNQREDAIIGSSTTTQILDNAQENTIVVIPVDNVAGNHFSNAKYVKLYQAAMKGDWKRAETIIKEQEDIVISEITSNSEIALHIAVAGKHNVFVRNLIGKMDKGDLVRENKDGNTALCFAATLGVVDIAKMLIEKNSDLPNIPGGGGVTPIHMAALYGHSKMVEYLYRHTTFGVHIDGKFISLFHAMISADLYDVALQMWNRTTNKPVLALAVNLNKETALHLMARKPSTISNKSQLNMFKNFANSIVKGFAHEEKMRTFAHQLVKGLWETVLQIPLEEFSEFLRSPPRLLFDAAKSGNFEFLVILIRSYPDVIRMVDDKSLSLFHIAALNRHDRIFNIIYEIKGIKNLIASHREDIPEIPPDAPHVKAGVVTDASHVETGVVTDAPHVEARVVTDAPHVEARVVSDPHVEAGVVTDAPHVEAGVVSDAQHAQSGASTQVKHQLKNNFLHLVARLPPQNRLRVVSGAALQMQREVLWFKAVEKIVPRSYITAKNNDGEVAHDIFTKHHEDLRKEGEKWMKETATACMVVATLIATMVFASVFAIPGGSNDEGLPIFKKEFCFHMFILSDSVALLSSLTSVVIFLSILTSRYAEDDFRRALPAKLVLGLLALFVSIISMVIAFTSTMILIHNKEFEWGLILIIWFASLTVISFTRLHYKLWVDTLRSAYSSKFLFYGRKSGLFL